MSFTLLEIAGTSFRTSVAADRINDELMKVLGLKQRYAPARLAIARSISLPDSPPLNPVMDDDQGRVIKGDTLFGTGSDLAAWVAMIVEADGRANLSKKEIQLLTAAHWHRGAHILLNEWEGSNGDFPRFLTQLVERAGFTGRGSSITALPSGGIGPEARAVPVVLRLGSDVAEDKPVTWAMNAPGVSPHIAAMGTLGTGKTRTAMELLRQIKAQSGCASIIFDFKGDLAEDRALVEALEADVITCPSAPIPLDVIRAAGPGDQAVNEAAIRFRDSFSRVSQSRPGGAQLDALRDAAARAIRRGGRVTINDIREALIEVYEETRRRPDSVVATFNDLCSFRLFEPMMSPEDFFSRTWIIDVHGAPETAQKFVAFLLLDSIDAWFMQLRDAPLDSGNHRAIRMVVAIDEARRVLGYKLPSLINIVRMSRSKGGAVMLISQSPDDFGQEEEDFLSNIGLTFSFRTNAAPGSLRRVFNESVDLAGLQNGVCITRLPDPDRRRPIKVRAWGSVSR